MTDCDDAFDRLLSSSNMNIVSESAKITSGGNNPQDSDSEDEIARPVHSKKAVLNDSSDEDTPVIFKKGILDFSDVDDKETQSDSFPCNVQSEGEDIGHKRKSKKRIKKVIDDSDDESAVADLSQHSPSPRRFDVDDDRPSSKIPDARSDDDNCDSDSSVKSDRSSRSSKSGRSASGSPRSSSGEESEREISIEAIKSKIISKHSASKSSKLLTESGRSASGSPRSSSGEESEREISIEAIKSKIISKHSASKSSKLLTESGSQDPEKKARSKPKKEKAPSRKAKEAALAEIHSETQRMMRERQISLPYHKPKQRSLADFLNRRKLAPTVRLKTTSDELAKVWKHAEEREKTAELFYKSESDEETEKKDCGKDKSAKSTDETVIPQKEPSESVEDSKDASRDETAADRLQGLLNQPVASVSQPMDSEEFPRLQLSEILVDSENTANVNSSGNSYGIQDNDGSLKIDLTNVVVDSAERCVEAVMTDKTDDVDSAPLNDTELIENSENTLLQSSILEDSVPLSGFSQSSLSEKINSLNLSIPKCPKISGAPDEVIDLDELSTKPGAFGLMRRFIKHSKLKSKTTNQHHVLSVMTSEVNDCGEIINLSEETLKVNKKVEPKPGERLVVLKTTLQQKMAENRGQQLAKKFEEYKLYEEEFYGVDQDEGEEDMFSEDECSGKEKKEEKDEDEDIDNPFLENEADESGNEEGANDDDDEEYDVNEDNMEDGEKSDAEETASVLLGGDSDEESEVDKDESNTFPVSENEETDEDEVVLTPSIPAALHSLAGTQNAEPIDESQLMALCSGNFSSSTIDLKVLETSSEAFQNVKDGESLGTSNKELPKHNALDSDDEEILASKKQKTKKRKLSFSDDEDSTKDNDEAPNALDDDEAMKLTLNGDEATEKNEDDNSDAEKQEEDLFEEDEDDEEVQLAKKLSRGFLDKEAELSESEWGSEDEDEKGLDQYEEEEGDKEKISQRRLQKELGKIHMREVLADDNREIRILQELLLEDGDLHSDGPKRQRLFRWYNQDEDNPGEKRPLDLGENANENEEEDEELWRRHRLERENYLRKKKIDNLEVEIVGSPVNFNDTRKGIKVTPKITPTTNKSPDHKSNFNIFSKRGSFLGRGEKMLSKLAEITNNAGTKENALGNSRNNRNMVFSVVSPPKEKQNEELMPEAPLKRKGDFIATSIVKKIKFTRNNVTTKVSALDQLKLFEST